MVCKQEERGAGAAGAEAGAEQLEQIWAEEWTCIWLQGIKVGWSIDKVPKLHW